MSNSEEKEVLLAEQIEEFEVLQSIYDGDSNFKCINDHTFQYKFGDEEEPTSILLEIKWPSNYPSSLPIFGLNAFYNNHLSTTVKTEILKGLQTEANKEIGTQLTYNIIEWVRENFVRLIQSHVANEEEKSNEAVGAAVSCQAEEEEEKQGASGWKTKEKKEQMTKSQKRKEWDRMDSKGEKQRGHDWVDLIKHLSQTGSKPEPDMEEPQLQQYPIY